MRFGKKADEPPALRARRQRQGRKTHRAALGAELLEPRQLLAGSSFAGISVSGQENTPFSAQPVASVNDSAPGIGTADFAATITWGDSTPATAGTVVATSQTGVFQILGGHTYAEEGTYTVRTSISIDGATPSFVQSLATVTDLPVVASGGFTVDATEGMPPPNQLLATFTDPAGAESVSDYSATVNWGDGRGSSATVIVDPNVPGQFLVEGGANHSYNTYGTYTPVVTISHDTAPDVTVTDEAIVSDASVVAQGGFTYTASEGTTGGNQTLATFTDPGGALGTNHYSATIDWGDGNTTSGTVQQTGSDAYAVVGSHAYVEEGPYVVTLVINHDISAPVTVQSSSSIADPAVLPIGVTPFTLSEGSGISNATVATFTDPGGPEDLGDYSAQIDWADGTVSPGVISFNASTDIFTVTGSHVYLTPGSEFIRITISHDIAPNAIVADPVTVNDPSLVATGGYSFTAVEGALSATQRLATFSDPGILDPLNEYGATIDWGDGSSSSAGTVTYNSSSQLFTVTGQHQYSLYGNYPIKVTLSNDAAVPVTVTASATVTDPPVQAIGGATVSALEYRPFASQQLALFTDPGGAESLSHYAATINWGDGTSSAGQIVSDPTGTTFSVFGSHTYAVFGTYNPTVVIQHDVAPNTTVTDTVNVGVPPIQITALPATWREWTVPVELSPLATLSFTDSQMTATIAWGDGATSAGVITPDLLGSSGTVRGSHTYTEAGNFQITITVNDNSQTVSSTIPTTVLRELLPIPNPNAGTPDEYYVAQVYQDLLRRPVDGQGLLYWSALLDEGVPRVAVANSLVTSSEYLTNFVIEPAYEKYLGRAPDQAGLQYWIGQMQHGLSDTGLVAALASSAEFYANSGGTNASYVQALYQNVLGRSPDFAGQAYWVSQLNAGVSRFSVALGFAASGEDYVNVVDNDYRQLLDRAPSPSELNTAVAELAQGVLTNEGLLASIAATDEFFSLAQVD
ncbi:MAG TPA: DUF4214 domain-containing protein [Pirellulales bacterium]|nr:DUF4214 domain-containing protein [Pirellulales bacterium]